MDKKAATFTELPFWILRFIPTLIVVIFIAIVLTATLSENIDYQEYDNYILTSNIIKSTNCLRLNQNTEVIDYNKLTTEHLNNCYKKNKQHYKVSLLDLNKNQIKSASVMPINLEEAIPICSTKPELTCTEYLKFIQYKKDNEIKPAYLKFEVVQVE